MAATREEDTGTEKQSTRLHASIVVCGKARRLACAVEGTRLKDRCTAEAGGVGLSVEQRAITLGRRVPHRKHPRLCGCWRGWFRAGDDRRFRGWHRCAHSNDRG